MPSQGSKKIISPELGKRVHIPSELKEEVLRKSRRRCCMCYGLNGDLGVKFGQLAHLDKNNRNPREDNLAFLCEKCHRKYDMKSNRVLGFTPGEVKHYRDLLYDKLNYDGIEWHITIRTTREKYELTKVAVDKAKTVLIENNCNMTINESSVDLT